MKSLVYAGNSTIKNEKYVLLERVHNTVNLAKPEINNDLNNDTDKTMVLNTEEMARGDSSSRIQVKIYLPNNAVGGDCIQSPITVETFNKIWQVRTLRMASNV